MAVTKPIKPPQKKITSTDITGFSGGLNLLGEQNAKGNEFVDGVNIQINANGKITQRDSLTRWLPDLEGTAYQIYPVYYDDKMYYFTADNGKIKYITDDDSEWQLLGGANTVTTSEHIKTTFLRVMDNILIMNGVDKLKYIKLSDKTVYGYTYVADPTTAPTATNTGVTSGDFKIYYAYNYSTVTGETKLSPILTHSINKPRSNWKGEDEYITITRPADNPTGAKSWNLYISLASDGGSISGTDMLMVAGGLDMNTTKVVDNGLLAIDISKGTAPEDNSTEGPTVTHGIDVNGRPVLFGDGYNIWIGGDGEYALDFSPSHGGYRAVVGKGTNYYPTNVIGFRNGQGIPSLTILFSSVNGLSKTATLEQQTVNYGEQSFVVWAVTEQNYGAAGVTSFYSVVNYKGSLSFVSTDGILSMDTQPQLQNVISTVGISKKIKPLLKGIKTESLKEIVGTAWSDKYYWIIPSRSDTQPNRLLVRDLNNNGAWYLLNIHAQWIGTISPPTSPAFIYVCQGNKIYKLESSQGAVDSVGLTKTPFNTFVKGALLGSNQAHNGYVALVKTVFYVSNLVGTITLGVNYRNDFGRIKTKKKIFNGPQYTKSSAGGWGDPELTFDQDGPATWGETVSVDADDVGFNKITKRISLPLGVIANEFQWFIETNDGYNSYQLDYVSFEGENLGVKPDLR